MSMTSDCPSKATGKPRSLLSQAVAFLSRREYSRRQLRERLIERIDGVSQTPNDVDQALDMLESKGYLNDERFAQALCRARSKRYGNARLALELRQAGVASEIARKVLCEQEDEYGRALEAWCKRFHAAPDTDKERSRQIRFLASRGFPYDVIRRVLEAAPRTSE